MVLEQLLRSGRQLVLGAALALSSAYGLGCGGDAQGCVKDTDCKDDRLCIENVCTGPDGSTGDDDDDSWHPSGSGCGDSPLFKKNFYSAYECSFGTVTPTTNDCTGEFTSDIGDDRDTRTFTYDRNSFTITSGEGLGEYLRIFLTRPTSSFFSSFSSCFAPIKESLSNQSSAYISCAEERFRSIWDPEVDRFLCYFSENPNLWMMYVEGREKCPQEDTILKVSAQPWNGESSCLEEMRSSSWLDHCKEEYPYDIGNVWEECWEESQGSR